MAMNLIENINTERLPKHVAIIMDGNGRWAKEKGLHRFIGHQNGVESVREVTEAATELGIEFLTLYAFSTENWGRPSDEVNALMEILVDAIENETPTLMKNDIRLKAIGALDKLPKNVLEKLNSCIEKTKLNTKTNLILALSYSSRWEIVNAAVEIAKAVKSGKINPEEITEDLYAYQLTTKEFPDPELMIRTSGEIRISNFLLYQLAYTELYFTPVLWPDFRKDEFYKAIIEFQKRERRFGKTSEQIASTENK